MMDESFFFSMPDVSPIDCNLNYVKSGLGSATSSRDAAEVISRFRLCYECGAIVASGDDFLRHVLAHEVVSISQQLYHFEADERREMEKHLRRYEKKNAKRLRKRQKELNQLGNHYLASNSFNKEAYVCVNSNATEYLLESLRNAFGYNRKNKPKFHPQHQCHVFFRRSAQLDESEVDVGEAGRVMAVSMNVEVEKGTSDLSSAFSESRYPLRPNCTRRQRSAYADDSAPLTKRIALASTTPVLRQPTSTEKKQPTRRLSAPSTLPATSKRRLPRRTKHNIDYRISPSSEGNLSTKEEVVSPDEFTDTMKKNSFTPITTKAESMPKILWQSISAKSRNSTFVKRNSRERSRHSTPTQTPEGRYPRLAKLNVNYRPTYRYRK